MKHLFSFLRFLLISILFQTIGFAQDSTGIVNFEKSFLKEDKHFSYKLPILIPSFSGTFASGSSSLEPEDNPSDGDDGEDGGGNLIERFFKKELDLEFFFLGQLKYKNRDFFVSADAYIGHIGGSFKNRNSNNEVVQLSIRTALGRVISGYNVYHYTSDKKTFKLSIAPFWGIRFQSIKLRSESHPEYVNTFQLLSPVAIDPLLGIEIPISLRRFEIETCFDIGGFNIQKRWSYLLTVTAGYRFNKFMSVHLGWTEYDVSKKVLFDKLNYKLHLRGPNMGLMFIF